MGNLLGEVGTAGVGVVGTWDTRAETGEEIGRHAGLWNFTLGQNAKIPGMAEKMFVSRKDSKTNTIFVVPGA